MNVYIWGSVDKCSSNYHTEGGVVVFSETEHSARELANSQPGCSIRPDEMPDHIRAVCDGDERVYTFPNAGCC